MKFEPIWGRRPVTEVIRAARRRIHQLYLARGVDLGDVSEMIDIAKRRDIGIRWVDRGELKRYVGGEDDVHQGVVALADPYPYTDVEAMLALASRRKEEPFLVLGAHIEDPHNLGSILRTAECAGVHGVIIPRRRAAGVTPTVVRVSAGASEHMAVARVTNLVRTVEELKTLHLWIYGTQVGGTSLYDTDTSGGVVLCFGSEGSGLPRLLAQTCDVLVELPLQGKVESLNVGVAAGVTIYEVLRRRMSTSMAGY
ncbi:MAG: 23S rRNA (guanosine(2251)-2'-O)-methyltransferase RlmB [Clostridia bacterium]